jgi:hypothetical protein
VYIMAAEATEQWNEHRLNRARRGEGPSFFIGVGNCDTDSSGILVPPKIQG